MTEYWQSQARKFCDFCKCWIADQKCSIEFHENGKRHQQAVKDRLRDIGQKGARDEKRAAKEEVWLKQIEQQAMKDYRAKDLQDNSDLTAKIFNEKRCERDQERASAESQRMSNSSRALALETVAEDETKTESLPSSTKAPGPPSWGVPTKSSLQVPQSSLKKNPFEQRTSAKTHGTRYHNPPPATKWREAITDDGSNTYYWHTETHASTWEPPADGYLSIKEQNKLVEKQQKIEQKVPNITKLSKVKPSEATDLGARNIQGPAVKQDPYGSWQPIKNDEHESNRLQSAKNSKPIDYQTPEVKHTAPSVTLHNDRTRKFQTDSRKTPSLGPNDDLVESHSGFQVDYGAGIKSTSKTSTSKDSTETSEASIQIAKPAIVFRKRKVNPDHRKVARRREDGD